MQAALAPRGNARTFLTHFVGSGLDDDRYVVQRYLSQANGDIVPVGADGTKSKGRLSRAAATAKPDPGRCVSPLGLCPHSEKHRPNPTGCYAALQLRREITA